MSNLDFSVLTDDQLVELIRAAAAEAISRGAVVETAARTAILTEAERLEISHDAERAAQERLRKQEEERVRRAAEQKVMAETAEYKQQREWAMQKRLARMVTQTLGSGWQLNVWSKDGEKRVYLDGANESAGGRVEYYHTGNSRNAPKSMKGTGVGKATRAERLIICELACTEWNSVKIWCDTAAVAQVPDLPIPDNYTQAYEQRKATEPKTVDGHPVHAVEIVDGKLYAVVFRKDRKRNWKAQPITINEDGSSCISMYTDKDVEDVVPGCSLTALSLSEPMTAPQFNARIEELTK